MSTSRRRFLTLSTAALAMPVLPGIAWADWPKDRTIRAIIPFNAGSTVDILGRIVADPLSRQLGQTIVIENRGGAGGSIGTGRCREGRTGRLHNSHQCRRGIRARRLLIRTCPMMPLKTFASVACFGSVPNVLLVAPSLGVKTLKEFVAKAKAGKLTYASAGVGSATHWAAEAVSASVPALRARTCRSGAAPRR